MTDNKRIGGKEKRKWSLFCGTFGGICWRGVLIQPPQEGLFLTSEAHTDEDIDLTLERAREAMPHVAEAVASGRVGPTGGVR